MPWTFSSFWKMSANPERVVAVLVSLGHLVAAGQYQPRAEGGLSVHGRDHRGPAGLVSPVQRIASLLVELKPLLAAAIGHPAVQRHVAVVRLCGLVDGQLGLFRSEGVSERGRVEEKRERKD